MIWNSIFIKTTSLHYVVYSYEITYPHHDSYASYSFGIFDIFPANFKKDPVLFSPTEDTTQLQKQNKAGARGEQLSSL